jgi:hypothetical protein
MTDMSSGKRFIGETDHTPQLSDLLSLLLIRFACECMGDYAVWTIDQSRPLNAEFS